MSWAIGIVLAILLFMFVGAILSINSDEEKQTSEPIVSPEPEVAEAESSPEKVEEVQSELDVEQKPILTKDENWEQRRLDMYRYLQMVGKEHQLNERELDVKHIEQKAEIHELQNTLVDTGLDQREKDIEQKILEGDLKLRENALEMNEKFFEREKDLANREIEFKINSGQLRLRVFELLIKETQQKHIEFLWKEYKTLDVQKIQLMNQENNLRVKYAMKEMALIQKDIEQKKEDLLLKEWESELHVEFDKLKLKQNAWDYLEQRVLVRAGIKTTNIDTFVKGFVSWDNRAREFGHAGAEGFMQKMFDGNYYERLLQYKEEYHLLLEEVEQLRLAIDQGELELPPGES